jgi:hypothetical protein
MATSFADVDAWHVSTAMGVDGRRGLYVDELWHGHPR